MFLKRLFRLPTLAILFFAALAAQAEDWPAFRGPTGDGRSSEKHVIPPEGSLVLEVAWKTSLGSGYSGIAVAEDVLVTQASLPSDADHGEPASGDFMVALDTESGETLW